MRIRKELELGSSCEGMLSGVHTAGNGVEKSFLRPAYTSTSASNSTSSLAILGHGHVYSSPFLNIRSAMISRLDSDGCPPDLRHNF
jgi:hypothetical protein